MTNLKGAEPTAKQMEMSELRAGVITSLNTLMESEAKRQRNKEYQSQGTIEEYELYGETFKRVKKEEYTEQEKKLFGILKATEDSEFIAIVMKDLYELYKRLETTSLFGDDKDMVKPIKHPEFLSLFKDATLEAALVFALKIKTQILDDVENMKKDKAFENARMAQQKLEEDMRQQLEDKMMADSQADRK